MSVPVSTTYVGVYAVVLEDALLGTDKHRLEAGSGPRARSAWQNIELAEISQRVSQALQPARPVLK
jgi:hypothetical protein